MYDVFVAEDRLKRGTEVSAEHPLNMPLVVVADDRLSNGMLVSDEHP
jgi:hypothetical protein